MIKHESVERRAFVYCIFHKNSDMYKSFGNSCLLEIVVGSVFSVINTTVIIVSLILSRGRYSVQWVVGSIPHGPIELFFCSSQCSTTVSNKGCYQHHCYYS